jgi:hypothetical protein
MKVAERGAQRRLGKPSLISPSSRADDECHPDAMEMNDLSGLPTYPEHEHAEEDSPLGPDGNGSDIGDEPTETYMLYTPDEEAAVIRAFDRRLVLFIALLYMLSFLDRSST